MPVITEIGLMKHLEEIVAVGSNRYEAICSYLSDEEPGEKGTLLKDNLGFYIRVKETHPEIRQQETHHVRRVDDGNAVVIAYGGEKRLRWMVYDVVLK